MRPLHFLVLVVLSGCASTPSAKIEPARSSVKTSQGGSPESHTRRSHTTIRVNTPDPSTLPAKGSKR